MTTTDDSTIEQPGKGWKRESSHEVITRFAEGDAPYHMCESDQLALLLQIMCKELQALSNEVVELQNAAELAADQ
jgi:hypothetical protein